MPRQPHSPTPVEPDSRAYIASPLPPCRVSREFAEEIGLEPFSDEAPAPVAGVAEGRMDSTSAPRSVALPTLPPEAVPPPRHHGARVGKITLLVAGLTLIASVGYTMGRADGRIAGELHETQAQLVAIADAASSARASLEARALEAPVAVSPLAAPAGMEVAPPPAPLPIVPPTVVQSPMEESDSASRTAAIAESRQRPRRSQIANERRAPRLRAAERPEEVAMASEAPEPVGVASPSSEEAVVETPRAPIAALDPLAGAVGPELAARLGLMHAPPELEVRDIGELPERPSRMEVSAAIHRILPQVRACGHEGTLRVGVLIRPDGRVVDARIEEGEPSPGVAGCVLSTLREARVAPFSGPEIAVSHPIRF